MRAEQHNSIGHELDEDSDRQPSPFSILPHFSVQIATLSSVTQLARKILSQTKKFLKRRIPLQTYGSHHTMNFLQRKPKRRPYAANSTGRLRGTLNPGSRIGRVQVYEAIGEAREIFSKLSHAILTHLSDNSGKLQDSPSFVDFSLFMMGKSRDRTKPIVMFVSDDKQARREAFRMIKESGILIDFPGFGLGEMDLKAEFENLQFLGSEHKSASTRAFDTPPTSFRVSDDYVEVLTTKTGPLCGRRLVVDIQDGSTTKTSFAVAGGVVICKGFYLLHSVNHFLQLAQPRQEVDVRHQIIASEEAQDECEIMGLSDDEGDVEDADDDDISYDDDDHWIDEIYGSAAPSVGDSESTSGSPSESDELGGSVSSFKDQDIHVSDMLIPLETPSSSGQRLARIGQVVMRSVLLDSAFIHLDTTGTNTTGLESPQLRNEAIPLESFEGHIETTPSDAALKVTTPDGIIGGVLSGTPSFVRLPGSRIFQEMYVAKVSRPLSPGDCGSWVKHAVTGKLFGHVIAGSPKTGLVLVMPAAKVFAQALATFLAQETKLQKMFRVSNAPVREDAWGLWWSPAQHLVCPGISNPPPPNQMLWCEFSGLMNCYKTFGLDDEAGWISHHIEHFHGSYPRRFVCWFCNRGAFVVPNTQSARATFEDRMQHIRWHILDQCDLSSEQMRPDFYVVTHLHDNRLIDDLTFNHAITYSELPEKYRPPNSHSYQQPQGLMDGAVLGSRDGPIYHDLEKERRAERRKRKGKQPVQTPETLQGPGGLLMTRRASQVLPGACAIVSGGEFSLAHPPVIGAKR